MAFRMMLSLRLVLTAALFVGVASVARADTIAATGQGWCTDTQCNHTDTNTLSNTFAGSHGNPRTEFRDWFAFSVPALGDILSATINIWNDRRNYTEADAVFELRDAQSIDFGRLAGSATLGSIRVRTADNGISRFVAIPLNAEGLRRLNAARGGQFLLGGVVTPFDPSREVEAFGYTTGPPAAFLDISASAAPVPEPSTLLLAASGGLALMRKRWRRARPAL